MIDKIYVKISPLGPREGQGTFDCVYNTEKYATREQAEEQNDLVVIDFVKDETGTIFFHAYHTKEPAGYQYLVPLQVQHFPFGIDMFDDAAAIRLAQEILANYDLDKNPDSDAARRN